MEKHYAIISAPETTGMAALDVHKIVQHGTPDVIVIDNDGPEMHDLQTIKEQDRGIEIQKYPEPMKIYSSWHEASATYSLRPEYTAQKGRGVHHNKKKISPVKKKIRKRIANCSKRNNR